MRYPILLPNIFDHPFTYESDFELKIGDYVKVPFGKSNATGVVWDEFEKNNKKKFKIKKILAKLEVSPLKKDTIKFLNWFSKYNLIPKGMALKLSLLSSQAIENLSEEKYKDFEVNVKNHSFELSKEQKKSLKLMNKFNNKFRVHVLQGTTGSGKTIVYFEALKVLTNKGFQGLILLPEIGLTGQFEQKFLNFLVLSLLSGIQVLVRKKKKLYGVV
jgi:primosomal protein N' (replication factor Y)